MTIDEVVPATAGPDEEEVEAAEAASIRDVRLAKIELLRDRGVDPYPNKFESDSACGDIRSRFGGLPAGEETDHAVRVAGRIMLVRSHGKLIFASLRDRSGEIQLFISEAVLGEQRHHDFASIVDRGDWIGVVGTVMVTRTGELSVKVSEFQMLAKSIRPLPDKWKGLTDTDTRYRQRYVDLIARDDTRRTFEIRFKAIEGIRDHLRSLGYYEVETPALSLIQGGATARPFITHYNALNIDSYLRIALELPLKRLIVGGLEKVFEIGRVFRNEGMDTRHNPEFTMLEAYEAFADYRDMMRLTEELVVAAARAALGTTIIPIAGNDVELAEPWRRATMTELIKEYAGVEINPAMPIGEARRILDEKGVHYEDSWGAGKLTVEMYDAFVEENLIEPTFVIDHPKEVSPLAKSKPGDPTLTERFELVVAGRELANAYSELNDPIDQLERFEDEARAKQQGDPEAGDVDYDYIRALEYGLPPTGGLGIGIDRLIMLLAGVDTIREVILFPTLRPEHGEDDSVKEAAQAERTSLAPHRAAIKFRGSPHSRTPWRVRLVAFLTAVTGVFYLFSLSPVLSTQFEAVNRAVLSPRLRGAGAGLSVLIGVVLIYLASQLRKRKRRAWSLTLLMFIGGAAVNIVKDLDLSKIDISIDDTPEMLAIVMVVILLLVRKDFKVAGDPPSWLTAIKFIPAYLGLVLVVGFVALYSQRDAVQPSLSFGASVRTILGGLVGIDGAYTYVPDSSFATAFPGVLLALGIIGLAVFVVLAFRPIVARATRPATDLGDAEKLVRDFGSDTLAPFTLRPDKSFFFSSDGRAMVAYAYLGRTALVSADPVGAPGSIDLVLDEFLSFCEGHGWDVAFLAVRDDQLDRYHARGLNSFYLGDEAIIDCVNFKLEGPAMKAVRQAVNRVERDYDFTLVKESEAEPELVDRLNEISSNWRKGNDERGFTMTLGEDVTGERPDFLLAVGRAKAGGKVVGFLRIVPAYGKEMSYTLDLMRHDPEAPNGMTEFLTAQTAMALKGRGVARLSMNFAAWGQLWHDNVDFTAGMRVLKWFVEKMNPYFQIKSLYEFNEKFDPDWLPRSMVCTSPAALPKVGVLFGGVEGFVEVPVVGHYLVPKVLESTSAASTSTASG
ncbi:MAG: lysine--tRNA ligase [Actinobacteria bacterium]|nr:lysine--tRNA ligase [Actinomycetota bacterium]